jgi:hypothetical protein
VPEKRLAYGLLGSEPHPSPPDGVQDHLPAAIVSTRFGGVTGERHEL